LTIHKGHGGPASALPSARRGDPGGWMGR
jgi:hypothetical protein